MGVPMFFNLKFYLRCGGMLDYEFYVAYVFLDSLTVKSISCVGFYVNFLSRFLVDLTLSNVLPLLFVDLDRNYF